MQQDRLREIQMEKKEQRRQFEKQKRMEELKRKQEKEEKSYDRIMNANEMRSNTEVEATVDNTAAEAYEEDFF
jgi:hypothetical protein